jgi:Arc/MetJ family transcription regulator
MRVSIDNDLATKAQLLTNSKTKKAAVEMALELLIRIENQKKLLDLWGKIEMVP